MNENERGACGRPELWHTVRQMEPQLLSWYHDLHRMPETGLSLPQTCDFVCQRLEEMRIPFRRLPDSTGVLADIGLAGPTVALRADMDALEVKEETGLPFASHGNRMHACGHDAHIAMLLTAAAFLKERENELPGRVRLIFQTDEEGLTGAKHAIENGALENPRPCRVLALHAGSFCGEGFASGDLILSEQVTFFSSDSFRVTVRGMGGHAASPHLSVDPVVAACRVVENLQTLVSREVKPSIPAVVSVTHICAGAPTYNVIPAEAKLMGGIRTASPETREYLKRRLDEVCRQTAACAGASAEVEFVAGCPAVINDGETAHAVANALGTLFPGDVRWMQEANGCSEDASYYFERVPGCYLFLASLGKTDGKLYPHHNARFCLDETVLWKGAAALARGALCLMERENGSI